MENVKWLHVHKSSKKRKNKQKFTTMLIILVKRINDET